MISAVLRWMKQPTSVAGASVVMSALAAWATGTATINQAIVMAVGGLVAIALPDNSTAKADAMAVAEKVLNEPPHG